MNRKVETGISLYELNKQAMRQLPPQSQKKLQKSLTSIGVWFGTFKQEDRWFMLLCREKYDYTVFHFKNPDYNQGVLNLKECIENRGQLFAIDYFHKENAYEIWIRNPETKEVSLYMLFNWAPMIIEI